MLCRQKSLNPGGTAELLIWFCAAPPFFARCLLFFLTIGVLFFYFAMPCGYFRRKRFVSQDCLFIRPSIVES